MPGGEPPDLLDPRVASVERRLADIERRFDALHTPRPKLSGDTSAIIVASLAILTTVLLVVSGFAVLNLKTQLEEFVASKKNEMAQMAAVLPYRTQIDNDLDILQRHSLLSEAHRAARKDASHDLNKILQAARGTAAWFAVATEFRRVLPELRLEVTTAKQWIEQWHDGRRAECWICVTLMDAGPSDVREAARKTIQSLHDNLKTIEPEVVGKIFAEPEQRDFRRCACFVRSRVSGTPDGGCSRFDPVQTSPRPFS